MKNNSDISRREFLKTGAIGLAGASLLSAGACSPREKREQSKPRKIIHRTLGRTGLRLPIVSMGSCYAIDLVQAALAEGIVYIHTSSGYAERNHERMLGNAVRGRPRDSFVVATSPDLPYRFSSDSGRSLDLGRNADPARIIDSLEGSLERLGLDHIDIYYLASIGSREATLYEPYLEAFQKLKEAGKTRFAGVTTHANEPAVIEAAVESGFWDVVLTSYNFRQSHREDIRKAIAKAAGAGLGVVAMKTQAGVFWDRARTRKIDMKAALKWVLQDENVHTTIPAFSSYEEMVEDLEVMADPTLTPQERDGLELGARLGLSGHYCQQCGTCLQQCPADMDIPTLMRGYMYAFGHQEPNKARDTLQHWTSQQVACTSCDRCNVQCSLGFDVRSRALEITRFMASPESLPG